jgi:hypothetical protein
MSFLVYLDSNDESGNAYDCSWNLNISTINLDKYYVSVEEICFTNNVTPINNLTNKLQFNEGSGSLSLTLTNGDYNGADISSELQTQLNAAGSDTYTVSYSSITKKITIASSGTFVIESCTNNCYRQLGFSPFSVAVSSYTSSNLVFLLNSLYVDVHTSIRNYNYNTSRKSDTIMRVHLDKNFGDVVKYSSFESDKFIINDSSLYNFNVRLFNDEGNPFEIGDRLSVVLKFEPLLE